MKMSSAPIARTNVDLIKHFQPVGYVVVLSGGRVGVGGGSRPGESRGCWSRGVDGADRLVATLVFCPAPNGHRSFVCTRTYVCTLYVCLYGGMKESALQVQKK